MKIRIICETDIIACLGGANPGNHNAPDMEIALGQ